MCLTILRHCKEKGYVPTPQNDQPYSNNSSANCREIIRVYLAILWSWLLKGLIWKFKGKSSSYLLYRLSHRLTWIVKNNDVPNKLLFDWCLFGWLLVNPLSANPTRWSNTLKQFVGNLLTNCLSVLDHFVILALKGLSGESKEACESTYDTLCSLLGSLGFQLDQACSTYSEPYFPWHRDFGDNP